MGSTDDPNDGTNDENTASEELEMTAEKPRATNKYWNKKKRYHGVPVEDDDTMVDTEMGGNDRCQDEYSATGDDDDDHSRDSLLSEERARRKKLKHKRHHHNHKSNDHSCLVVSVRSCFFLLLGIGIMGLVMWRYEHAKGHRDSDSGGNGAADQNAAAGPNKTIFFDPLASVKVSNPFDMTTATVSDNYYGSTLVPPISTFNFAGDSSQNVDDDSMLGYMMEPSSVNGTVVFVSEGDMYLASWKSAAQGIPAMKLTTTVGNVRNPIPNPVYPFLIAYTATYTGRRDIYLFDLRRRTHGSQPAMRLTYWDSSFGIRSVVGWKDNGRTLVFSAYSNTVSLQDIRLYEMTLSMDGGTKPSAVDPQVNDPSHPQPQVLQVRPVPLAQAINGVYHDDDNCWFFTRTTQSSRTYRYTGGTVETIWAWCKGQELAVPLSTYGFRGTSKEPSIFYPTAGSARQQAYLIFLSDRTPNPKYNPNISPVDDKTNPRWIPATMNLWAIKLPILADLSSSGDDITAFSKTLEFVQLTQVSCEFSGRPLLEYSLDPVTQDVVMRIGAELYWMSAEALAAKLQQPVARQLWQGQPSAGVPADSKVESLVSASMSSMDHGRRNSLTRSLVEIQRLSVVVYSDFHEQQERIIPMDLSRHVVSLDVFETAYDSISLLLGLRGQVWVAPVVAEVSDPYSGSGKNIPRRNYRVVPGSMMGGAVRVLSVKHVPTVLESDKTDRRLAIILATDPRSPTAEHAFYVIETHAGASPSFLNMEDPPKPFLGGHDGGGSTRHGGLGSVLPSSVTVSPCGRRLAWTDTDGRICVMTLPLYKHSIAQYANYTILPKKNEMGTPMNGDEVDLVWSPGGRYLAVAHNAQNQFAVISVVDCGDPLVDVSHINDTLAEVADIVVGRIVQVTPDRFNSMSPYWGKSTFDLMDTPDTPVSTTTLYFLTDRDIQNKAVGPWGSRAPTPYFERAAVVYALPLIPQVHKDGVYKGHFSGLGAEELFVQQFLAQKRNKSLTEEHTFAPSQAPTTLDPENHFLRDPDIEFGEEDLALARNAYRLANIPEADYYQIVSQARDDGTLLLIEKRDENLALKIFASSPFPGDKIEATEVTIVGQQLLYATLSTTRDYVAVVMNPSQNTKVVKNTNAGIMSLSSDQDLGKDIAATTGIAISVWPTLEYQQLFADAWRMLRDYFYDPELTGIEWTKIYQRYQPLVKRCAKREELDDVMAQMASELSALHVFVYGGEYSSPFSGDLGVISLHEPASLGVTVQRSAEWKGYIITSIPDRDPDYSMLDGNAIYSPLSGRELRLSGQKGLQVGDVIVGINGESVMSVPDMNMLLRGMAGQSVRLDVLRLASSSNNTSSLLEALTDAAGTSGVNPEPVLAVPISPIAADNLRYAAWEWETRERAKQLAADAGFTVGYAHLQSMMPLPDEDAFARGFFPDYDKEGFILDVRHNHGGNIDWWILDVLQRRAWTYWQGRSFNITNGGLGWDEQFSFRGHVVVLIDEHTSSDGEGVSRGISELGLGRLVGTRTWGGGIWLSSDNHMVDGGIATAPEIGTYNDNFGWGMGIEQMGVEPDVIVDNNPRPTFDGKDSQLERAISVLKEWIKAEPIVLPKDPGRKRDMSFDHENCAAE